MKKTERKPVNLDLVILACVVAVVLFVCIFDPLGYFNSISSRLFHEYIEADQVMEIDAPGGKMGTEDAHKFMKLFNEAKYKGEDIGYGTTPQYGVTVYFRDGSSLAIEEYGDHYFCVRRRVADRYSKGYFIESRKLDEFVAELVDRCS